MSPGGEVPHIGAIALLCNPYHRGGIERFIADLALAWARVAGDCWLVVPRARMPFHNSGTSQTVASLIDAAGRTSTRLHLIEPSVGAEFEFGTEAYRASVYARALIDSVPASVPVAPSDDPATWRAASWLAHRNPVVLVVHGDYDGYYARLKQYEARAAAIVPIARRVESRIKERGLGARACVHYIPTGIVLGLPRTDAPSVIHRLVWIGRMDEEAKRVSDLPRIAAALRDGGVEFQMTLIGDGDARSALEADVAEANLRALVRFRGWMPSEDVRTTLRESDVLLLPSNREGLPVVMMEALAAGCGVVASRVSGVEDYESHPSASHCLWLHDVGDVESAARLVARALAVPPAQRAARARALAEAEFSIERCVQRYSALIASLPRAQVAGVPFGSLRRQLIRFASAPIAAERRLRLWAADSVSRTS